MPQSLPRSSAFVAFLLILLAGAAVRLSSQGISEDEVRFRSRPYVPPSANAIHVESNAVQVPVVVTDSQGKAVAGLKQSDFHLFDDGHPVKIASFAIENAVALPVEYVQAPQVVDASLPPVAPRVNPPPPTPRYVALFFDDISMRMPDMVMARTAAESYVKNSLKPNDRVGIFTTSTTVQLNFTSDVPKLLETLAQLLSHRKPTNGGSQGCQMNEYQASVILQFAGEKSDALDLAAYQHCGDPRERIANARNILGQAEQSAQNTLGIVSDVIRYLGRMPGQRMLVLASSGFLTQTLSEKQDKLINQALNANVIINSLDAKGLAADIPGYDEEGQPIRIPAIRGDLLAVYDQYKRANRDYQSDSLAVMADGTGGQFFHNRNDLDAGLKEMATAPNVSYVLMYYPAAQKRNNAPHTLKVKLVDSHGLNVTARRGYVATVPNFAATPNLTEPEKKKGQLDVAVISTDLLSALTAEVVTSLEKSAVGEATLNVRIHLDVNNLPFETQGDRKVEKLIYITALFDVKNNFVAATEGVMDLRLKPETMATLNTKGLVANLSVQAAPGNYRLRQVVQEVTSGRIAAINSSVEIQ